MQKISRRNFLKSALAVTALPIMATAKDEQNLKFIHVTDSHMDLSDTNSIEALELMVEYVNENYKNLDFVLFGGDNFNNLDPKNSDALKFKEIVGNLHCPSFAVRGNKESSPEHDDAIRLPEFQTLFCSDDALSVQGKDWVLNKNGYYILGLDSCIEDSANGRYTQETIAFARSILDKGKPTLMVSHHPYTDYKNDTKEKDLKKYVLKNTKEAQEQLFTYDNLILALSGHSHVDSVRELHGTKTIVTRGFIRPIELDMYPMRYIELNGNKISEKLIYTE